MKKINFSKFNQDKQLTSDEVDKLIHSGTKNLLFELEVRQDNLKKHNFQILDNIHTIPIPANYDVFRIKT